MKKLYFLIALFAVGLLVFTITAQKTNQSPQAKFKPGWFIGANGGVNWFLAEGNDILAPNNNNSITFKNNVGYQFGGSLGYDFTPVYALRGTVGYNLYNHYRKNPVTMVENVTKIPNTKLNMDLLVNLTNLSKGYDPNRKMNLSVFAGLGGAYINKNVNTSKVAGIIRGGLQGDYYFSKQLALNLILDGNLLTDNYSDEVSELPFDISAGLAVGLTYRFPEKTKPKVVAPGFENVPEVKPEVVVPEVKPEVPVVVVPEKPQVAVVDTPKAVVPEVKPVPVEVKPEIKPVVKPETVAQVPSTKENLFFKFNSRVVETASQEENLARLADYMKKNPTAKIIVSGYADKSSGTDEINDQISKQRAVNVANALINKYGIDPQRLMVKWYGSKVQPFEEIWKNRVVIVNTVAADKLNDFKPFTEDISSIINEAATRVEINFAVENAEIANAKQREALTRITNYLKSNPDAKVYVEGYASNSSGTVEYNDGISKKRAITVANLLIKDYGVAYDRIKVSWFGGRVQPYKVAVMNQLVIVKAQ